VAVKGSDKLQQSHLMLTEGMLSNVVTAMLQEIRVYEVMWKSEADGCFMARTFS
jgi:hypothetical protein